jgi:hypothetical protein
MTTTEAVSLSAFAALAACALFYLLSEPEPRRAPDGLFSRYEVAP